MITEYEKEIEKWNKEQLNIENALLWKMIKDLTQKRRKVLEELLKRQKEETETLNGLYYFDQNTILFRCSKCHQKYTIWQIFQMAFAQKPGDVFCKCQEAQTFKIRIEGIKILE